MRKPPAGCRRAPALRKRGVLSSPKWGWDTNPHSERLRSNLPKKAPLSDRRGPPNCDRRVINDVIPLRHTTKGSHTPRWAPPLRPWGATTWVSGGPKISHPSGKKTRKKGVKKTFKGGHIPPLTPNEGGRPSRSKSSGNLPKAPKYPAGETTPAV